MPTFDQIKRSILLIFALAVAFLSIVYKWLFESKQKDKKEDP